jgi:hypothetical protein
MWMKQRGDWYAVALLTAFGVFVYSPLLFFGKAFAGEEQMGFYYVISHYLQEALLHGSSLLWNGGYYGGVSASLDQFVGAWYPLNRFLFSTFSLFTAHHLSMCIATIAGLLLCYWYGRNEGWLKTSALMLAFGYFSATTFAWIAIGTTASHSFAIFPGILVALQYLSRRKHFVIPVLGGALALGVGLLAGFVQIVFYEYVLAGLYALYLDYNSVIKNTHGVALYKRPFVSYGFACITLIGLAVGIFQFYPSAHLIDLTIRTSDYAIQNATHPSFASITELVTYVLPPYFAIPFMESGSSAGFYVGAIGFLFVLLGLLFYRTRTSLFFLGVYAFVMLFAFHAPVFGWLNEHVPPFSRMGGNFRWSVAAAFPIAYLAASGMEGYLRNPQRLTARARATVLTLLALIIVLAVAGSIALTVLANWIISSSAHVSSIIAWYANHHTLLYAHEYYQDILIRAVGDVAHTFALSNGRFLFAMSMWALAALWFAGVAYSARVRVYASQLLVLLLVINSAGVIALQFSNFAPQSIYAETPGLVTLLHGQEKNRSDYRILGFLLGDGIYTLVNKQYTPTPEEMARIQHEILIDNATLYFAIDRMDGLEPYRTLRHNQLLQTVVAYDTAAFVFDPMSTALQTSSLKTLYNREVMKQVTLDEKKKDFLAKLPILSMMNVKYIYSLYELHSPTLARVGTVVVPDDRGHTLAIYLYKNVQALPRIYFAEVSEFATGHERDLLLRLLAIKDFSKTSLIECGDCAAERVSGTATLAISHYENGDVAIETESEDAHWLVFSESYMPGWTATIDGTATPIYRANYLFQAVRVPAGKHAVHFVYHDVSVLP